MLPAVLPFQLFPARGLPAEDAPTPPGPGVFDVPGCLEDGTRLLLAYDEAGHIVSIAWVEPGGDIDEATRELHRAAHAS